MGNCWSWSKHLWRRYRWTPYYWNAYFQAPPLLPKEKAASQYNPNQRLITLSPIVSEPAPAVGVVLFMHAPWDDADRVCPALQGLANRARVHVLVWEYPGYGHLRRPVTNSDAATTTWAQIPVHMDLLMLEAEEVLVTAMRFQSHLPFVLMAEEASSAFAVHLLSTMPSGIHAVILHNAWTSWSNVTRDKGMAYTPIWAIEPNLFDNVAAVHAIEDGDVDERAEWLHEFQGRIIFTHAGRNTRVPPERALELVEAFRELLDEQFTPLSAPDKRVDWVNMPHWDHFMTWAAIQEGLMEPMFFTPGKPKYLFNALAPRTSALSSSSSSTPAEKTLATATDQELRQRLSSSPQI